MSGSSTNGSMDIATQAFIELDDMFFDSDGNPQSFYLRPKENTQDDPFDEYIQKELADRLSDLNVEGSSPLVSPDIAIYDPDRVTQLSGRVDDLQSIVSVEVKKLERTAAGNISRASGLDYNSTPPCGTVRVHKPGKHHLDISSFYLFACLEEVDGTDRQHEVSAFVLCDGDVLNEDFDLYKSVAIESREKEIGLGTYGDGMDRQRPMFVFPNPVGADEMDHEATLMHPGDGLGDSSSELSKVYNLVRSDRGKDGSDTSRTFYCYRTGNSGGYLGELENPFPTPGSRSSSTQSRGKFTLDSL